MSDDRNQVNSNSDKISELFERLETLEEIIRDRVYGAHEVLEAKKVEESKCPHGCYDWEDCLDCGLL